MGYFSQRSSPASITRQWLVYLAGGSTCVCFYFRFAFHLLSVCLSVCLFVCLSTCHCTYLYACLACVVSFSLYRSALQSCNISLSVRLFLFRCICMPFERFVCLSLCPPIYASPCLSVGLSTSLFAYACMFVLYVSFVYVCMYVYLYVYLSIYLSVHVCLSIMYGCLPICSSVSNYVYLSIDLFVYLSVCLPFRFAICQFVCLLICEKTPALTRRTLKHMAIAICWLVITTLPLKRRC